MLRWESNFNLEDVVNMYTSVQILEVNNPYAYYTYQIKVWPKHIKRSIINMYKFTTSSRFRFSILGIIAMQM